MESAFGFGVGVDGHDDGRSRSSGDPPSSRRGETRIRRLIERDGSVPTPGLHDALSVVIVQRSGFRIEFIPGYALSTSLKGKPDFGLLPLEQAPCSVGGPRDDDELREIGRRTSNYVIFSMLKGGVTPTGAQSNGFSSHCASSYNELRICHALIDILKVLK